MRAGPSTFLLSFAAMLAAAGCRSATEIQVEVTTDLPCPRANGGAWVDATIDPAKCEGSGCGESALGGGGAPMDAGVDATIADATVADATADAPGEDAFSDAPADVPIVPTGDGAVLGCDLRGLQP